MQKRRELKEAISSINICAKNLSFSWLQTTARTAAYFHSIMLIMQNPMSQMMESVFGLLLCVHRFRHRNAAMSQQLINLSHIDMLASSNTISVSSDSN